MLRNLTLRIEALWRRLEQVGAQERSILAVMRASSGQNDLRVWSIQERWRLLYATTVESGVRIRQTNRIGVVLYDCDLPEVDWREGLATLLNCAEPVFAIVLSHVVDPQLYLAVLDRGGYAVTAKPLNQKSLVPLINGSLQQENTIDSCRVFEQV